MILRILKKDMKRRKSVNLILFLFITIASVFLSSSISNIMTVFPGVNYYLDYANVPDISFISMGVGATEPMEDWIENEAPGVEEYGTNTIMMLSDKGVTVEKKNKKSLFETGGVTMYLGTQDSEYCKVFDLDGEKFTLKPGEIALSAGPAQRNDLKEGDHITIENNGVKKEFTFKLLVKDATFGNDMVGMTRLLINQEDYKLFAEDNEKDKINMYYVNTEDVNGFLHELNNQEFTSMMNSVTRDTYKMAYSFDMIMAALLILIGICLILIALLVLRFTLVFTLEEEYREIGIMKAVGLRDLAVRKLYLIKYFFIVSAGALAGLVMSVPISKAMIKGVSQNMIMADAGANLWINVICTILIIVVVLLFCYGCTGKLNKVSAITAIRGGKTGERFNRRAGIRLHKRKRMPVSVFLGINDMLSHMKRYMVLMVTFCISFILITIPLNTLNTMQSKEMVEKFAMDPDCAVYVRAIEKTGETSYKSLPDLKRGMKRVQSELKEKGYDAKFTAVPIYFFQVSEKGKSEKSNIMTIQAAGENTDFLIYNEGKAPELSNEIAFSENIMNINDWQIGDTVEAKVNGEKKSFVITANYSDYMQLGKSARLNPAVNVDQEMMFGYWNIQLDMETDKTQQELASELNAAFPDYEWEDAQSLVDQNVGGIQDSLGTMLFPMTGMLCGVIMLITLLMERLFIAREKGEIAMMKSVGYRNNTIRLWQIIRMVWVALVSMIAAVPISLLANHFVLKPIFALMGADVEIQIVPWKVYGVYPGVLLLGIIVATLIATGTVKKINIRELNNLE